jgi:hypothetical protein
MADHEHGCFPDTITAFRFISHPFPILLSGVFLSHKIGADFIPDSAVEERDDL